MAKDHVQSDKISGNHGTLIEAVIPIIKKLVRAKISVQEIHIYTSNASAQ